MRVRVTVKSANSRRKTNVRENGGIQQHPRRVYINLIHENRTKSTRLSQLSGLQCVQVFLKSIKRDVGKQELKRGDEEDNNKDTFK